MIPIKPVRVNIDDYFLVTVITKFGYKSYTPCRGVKLGSWIRFYDSLTYTESVVYSQSTREVYDEFYCSGIGEEIVKKKAKKSVRKKKSEV